MNGKHTDCHGIGLGATSPLNSESDGVCQRESCLGELTHDISPISLLEGEASEEATRKRELAYHEGHDMESMHAPILTCSERLEAASSRSVGIHGGPGISTVNRDDLCT